MSDLTYSERRSLESIFEMGSGYVLDFSNRTLDELVTDAVGTSIYEQKYGVNGTSKANRLRTFWKIEPNHVSGKLLAALLEHVVQIGLAQKDPALFERCKKIANRLLASMPVAEADALVPNTDDKDFATLAQQIKDTIQRNEPETGLDRLHTFVVKYLRALCEKRGITIDKDKPLHSLMGEYVKALQKSGELESEMSALILKMSISVLEAFNRVRNNQSFAHDNPILNYEESLLIFNHVAGAIRFLNAIEKASSRTAVISEANLPEDIPF
jgi:hypothetical protein